MASSIIVREAQEGDCPAIIDLIQGLADYENMSDYMKLTPEALRNDGFGAHPYFKCVVAEKTVEGAKTVVGYALGYFTYSTFKGRSFFMEDLYVHPDHRGQSAGSAMWKKMAQIAVSHNCQRMDFIVLNWNERSIAYYKSRGCQDLTIDEKWHLYRLPLDAMKKMAAGEL